eukprot:gene2677-885_t
MLGRFARIKFNCLLVVDNLIRSANKARKTNSYLNAPSFADPDGANKERQPVSQQLNLPSSYLGSFPYLSEAELEEPPPRVSAPVRRILENSKVRRVDGQVIKPKYNARKFAQLRKKYIAAGYYWPDKPMRDRNLDRAPAGGIREKRREERKKKIEEAMLNMPEIVAEYRKRINALRDKRKEEREKNKTKTAKIRALGLHPNDPRAKQILHEGTQFEAKTKEKTKSKKKFQGKSK